MLRMTAGPLATAGSLLPGAVAYVAVGIATRLGVFNRSTNVTGYYDQNEQPATKRGTCYAHAACSAFINTCKRIYGGRVPDYKECFPIADYRHGQGGDPVEAIRRLEEHFKCGVLCTRANTRPPIRDVISLSVIVSFTTSQQGWERVAKGDLTELPDGKSDGWHACLVEAYDFEADLSVCKNSWGEGSASGRFNLKFSALHEYRVTTVYFTTDSIVGKTAKPYIPRMSAPFRGELDGKQITCVHADEDTAKYETKWIFTSKAPDDAIDGPLEYLGYAVDEWIAIKLKRAPNSQ